MPSVAMRTFLPVLFSVVIVASASAQTTALFYESQPGDYIGGGQVRTYTTADATFSIERNYRNGVSLRVIGPDYEFWWYLDFAAAGDVPLAPGLYAPAARFPFSPVHAVDMSGNGRGCNNLTARYLVREIVYDGSGNVLRFAADVEQHCSNNTPALFAAIRYNSTIADLSPFDGNYPGFELSVTPPANGAISGGPIACGAGQPSCTAGFADATQVTLTATPDPGYFFAGWTGACVGGPATTFTVNSTMTCGATFLPVVPGLPRTFLIADSQAGDYAGGGTPHALSPANSRWTVTSIGAGTGVQVSIDFLDRNGFDGTWRIELRPPAGSVLAPGTYSAVRWPFGEVAGLNAGIGGGCSDLTGLFTVYDIAFGPGGSVERFAADFEQHCSDAAPGLFGALRHNSTAGGSSPFGGNYPRYSLSIEQSANGRVTGPGVACGTATAQCELNFGAATPVALAATAEPGFIFTGWTGDCIGGPATTVQVNRPKRCGATFGEAVASSPRSLLLIDSEAGDFIGRGQQYAFTPANSAWRVDPLRGRAGVRVRIDYLRERGATGYWDIELTAATGTVLTPGTYHATRYPFNVFAGMSVSGNSSGCNTLTGRFDVHDVAFAADGSVERFSADFEQHCDNATPALFGAIRYNSMAGSGAPFDGNYPRYTLTIAPPVHGQITGPGVNCDATRTDCAVTLGAAAFVALTATPNPGYVFTGWTGACGGASVVATVNVNMQKQCEATFDAAPRQTSLTIDSQTGDATGGGKQYYLTQANSVWRVDQLTGVRSGVSVSIEYPQDNGYSGHWSIQLTAPSGSALTPGSYASLGQLPFGALAGMYVSGNSGCGAFPGRFIVYDVAFAADGSVERLSADFEHHCGNNTPALFGAVRYNSGAGGVQPFGGNYPRYALSIERPSHGRVSGPGLTCDATHAECELALSAAASVTLTATPDPGYLFTGWSGSCAGAAGSPTATVAVNSIRSCSAGFDTPAPTAPRTLLRIEQDGSSVPLLLSPANSTWRRAWTNGYSGVNFAIEGINLHGSTTRTDVSFMAPFDAPLQPGTYSATPAFLRVFAPNLFCTGPGEFVVYELKTDATTRDLSTFAASFQQSCDSGKTIQGTLHFNSMYDISVPCSTPDPFAALGGGTCYNSGWLAPGTAPPPAPETPPVTPPTSGCATPDPFVALGGGTCYNGGWLPPGMASPSAPETPPVTPPTSGCATPDPFVALGGGTCYNGGWLPPGLAPPSATTPPVTAPQTPGSPPTAGCATPDPFVALGGGTCYNGGWLPPGMAPPSAPETPPVTPPQTPATPPRAGCATPDPFVALGGGTCYNGGWLPPGMASPSAPETPPVTPPQTPVTPTTSGCTTPDPFVTLGGGTCYNGGWLPPGMAPPSVPETPPPPVAVTPPSSSACATVDPFEAIAGLVGVCRNGDWVPVEGVKGTGTIRLEADSSWTLAAADGRFYSVVSGLDAALRTTGARVSFKAILRMDWTSTAYRAIEIVSAIPQ